MCSTTRTPPKLQGKASTGPQVKVCKYRGKKSLTVLPSESQGSTLLARRYPMKVLGGGKTKSCITDLRAFVKVKRENQMQKKMTLFFIGLQEGHIVKVESASEDGQGHGVDDVLEGLGGDLLYVDQEEQTPLVLIKGKHGLFG